MILTVVATRASLHGEAFVMRVFPETVTGGRAASRTGPYARSLADGWMPDRLGTYIRWTKASRKPDSDVVIQGSTVEWHGIAGRDVDIHVG